MDQLSLKVGHCFISLIKNTDQQILTTKKCMNNSLAL